MLTAASKIETNGAPTQCAGNVGEGNSREVSISEQKRVTAAPLYHQMPRPSLIDAETAQAAMGIRGAAAAIAGTIFADVEPFDPRKAVTDLVGS